MDPVVTKPALVGRRAEQLRSDCQTWHALLAIEGKLIDLWVVILLYILWLSQRLDGEGRSLCFTGLNGIFQQVVSGLQQVSWEVRPAHCAAIFPFKLLLLVKKGLDADLIW